MISKELLLRSLRAVLEVHTNNDPEEVDFLCSCYEAMIDELEKRSETVWTITICGEKYTFPVVDDK